MPKNNKHKPHPLCIEDRIIERQLKSSKTLKSKIQNAMFRSTLISQLILAGILIPGLISTAIPLGQFMTKGIATEIINRYDRNDQSTALSAPKKSIANIEMLDKLSTQQLVDDIKKMDMNMPNTEVSAEALSLLTSIQSEDLSIDVDPKTNDLKRLMVITNDQYKSSSDFFKKALPFLSLYTMTFNVDNYAFDLPAKPSMASGFLGDSIGRFIDQTASTITVFDKSGASLGSVKIGIDSGILAMIIVPYTLLVLGVSVLSLFIVSLLGKFMTHGILKPVTELNKQLKSMAGDDVENLHQAQLSVKRPPREVLQMTVYTNEILHKMNEFRHLLEEQNHELHSQNDELYHSKEVIQDQQNQLVQSEKMASIGQLSAAIIHEINTPMGAIKSNSQMTQMLIDMSKPLATEPIHKNLEKIQSLTDVTLQAAERITNIVRSLKNYSRLDQSEFKETDINDDIRSVVLLTSNLWKNKVSIVEELQPMPMVKCYSGLMNQVFMNLIVNAIDAMPEGGTLTLKTHVVDSDYAVFEVNDTGTGIEPRHLPNIFNEGYTTKPKDSGTGLGLALSKSVVEKHNGSIEVDTELGKGTTFRVMIPVSPEMT